MNERKRGRKGRLWFRTSDQTWCIKIAGKLHRLARGLENEAESLTRWHELMARSNVVAVQDKNEFRTFAEEYLDVVSPNLATETSKHKRSFLQSFCDRWPKLTVEQLRPYHLQQWMTKDSWSPTTRWTAGSQIMAVLNWAAEARLIPENPLRRTPIGHPSSRGDQAVTAPDARDLLRSWSVSTTASAAGGAGNV